MVELTKVRIDHVSHIHIGFWKGTWLPPHELLKSKLLTMARHYILFYASDNNELFLNGVKSDWVQVLSGIPQGTVLGPLLFSLYINDISLDIESEIRLFADECVDSFLCFRQRVVSKWSKIWLGSGFVRCPPGHRSWSLVVLSVHKWHLIRYWVWNKTFCWWMCLLSWN